MTEPVEIHVPAAAVEKSAMQRQIIDADWRVDEQETLVKARREAIQSEIEAMPEFKAVDDAANALDIARRKLDIAKLQNGDLNRMKEKLHEESQELKIRRDTVSHMLFHYTAEYRVKTIEVDGDNREIKIQAKIGKKLKHQMELPI